MYGKMPNGGNEVVRIGKSENILRRRMKQWENNVSNGLAGKFLRGSTNKWEASEWRKRLIPKRGELLVLRICIPDADLLKQREKELIKDYDPPLCSDARSARRRRQGK